MRALKWSVGGRRQFEDWIDYLLVQDSRMANLAAEQVEARVGKLAERAIDGRPSRWPGFRKLSLLRWRKIVVYDVTDVEVFIVAFYDFRQDLSAASPAKD